MKKVYFKPSIKMVIMNKRLILCASTDITSNNGITYGGVDEEGSKDPESRHQYDIWEEDEKY